MSKFWQGRLNASWKETVSSTVTGLSDGAARYLPRTPCRLYLQLCCLPQFALVHYIMTSSAQTHVTVTCGWYTVHRLRQNLQVPVDGRPGDATPGAFPETLAGKSQQYLRLPVESAKKLRWYDRPDLNNLIQQNLRDKNDLLGSNAALRQVCSSVAFSLHRTYGTAFKTGPANWESSRMLCDLAAL